MKKIALLLIAFFAVSTGYSQLYKGKTSLVHFLSKSSLEDIEAKNTMPVVVLDQGTGAIQVKVPVKSFKFASSYMEEHFNENYMESEKYPFSVFKGKLNEKVDYSKDGETKVTCAGKLEIHGVTHDVSLPGTIKIKNGEITLTTEFKVKLVDYKIKVPSLYVKNIAEEIAVDMSSTLEPFKKP